MPTEIEKKVARLLNDAAKHINKYGLEKEYFGNYGPGPKCIMGAIRYVGWRRGNGIRALAESEFAKFLIKTGRVKEAYGGSFTTIADWNDRPTIMKHHVVNAMKKCAANMLERKSK